MRSRIGRKVDAQRLAQLVSTPGIDPRVWVSLCIVDSVTVEDATPDGEGGIFADVHIMSTATLDSDGNVVAQKETVRVAGDYAGKGIGLFFPPAEGDEVVVIWPDGNPDHGGILVSRLWSASDPPPKPAIDNPTDAILMVGKDVNLRIVTQGQGNVVLQVDKGKVLLGNEQNTIPVARKGDGVGNGSLAFAFNAGTGAASLSITYTPGDGSAQQVLASGSGSLTIKEKITAGSSDVEAT